VRLTGNEIRTEFVCIPRPVTRSDRPDGGPRRYRVVHTASLWKPGERPLLRQQVIEGNAGPPAFRSDIGSIAIIVILAARRPLSARSTADDECPVGRSSNVLDD
jgi:hypothetical protein